MPIVLQKNPVLFSGEAESFATYVVLWSTNQAFLREGVKFVTVFHFLYCLVIICSVCSKYFVKIDGVFVVFLVVTVVPKSIVVGVTATGRKELQTGIFQFVQNVRRPTFLAGIFLVIFNAMHYWLIFFDFVRVIFLFRKGVC